MSQIIFEMGGGHAGEKPDGWRETFPPEWVRLGLTESSRPGHNRIRVIYGDDSFSEWRMRIVK